MLSQAFVRASLKQLPSLASHLALFFFEHAALSNALDISGVKVDVYLFPAVLNRVWSVGDVLKK